MLRDEEIFTSIQSEWRRTVNQDLKELIPQFFHGDGKFLINYQNVDFGSSSEGSKIKDVVLPQWA